MKPTDAEKVLDRYKLFPKAYTKKQVVEAHQALDLELTSNALLVWECEREGIVNKEAAKKIVEEFEEYPLAFSLSQIQKAHKLLGLKVDSVKIQEWAKDNPFVPLGRLPEMEPEPESEIINLPQSTTVEVGVVEAKIDAGEDGILGTEDDEVSIRQNLSNKTVVELKETCKSRGLSGYSKLTKAELIGFLQENED